MFKYKAALPIALLLSALALSACATKPKEEAVAAPAETTSEPTPAPAVEQPAPAPSIKAEPPAAKIVVKKHKRKVAKAAPPKVEEPAPVAVPEPAPAPAPVVKQEPAPPVAAPTPVQPVAEPGFLEKYWLWLAGIVIAAAAVFWAIKKKNA